MKPLLCICVSTVGMEALLTRSYVNYKQSSFRLLNEFVMDC